ncbi:peptidoglycan DD-metalloendopeptidase family protein [Patescibacteria group bacterium]|nr:peptidoglycan DD-metalloendopeptidase family protein [Patescibacteria group bacterium]
MERLQKNKRTNYKILLIIALFIVSIVFAYAPVYNKTHQLKAENSVEELNREIGEKKEKIKKIEEGTENLEQEIEEKQKEKQSLENQLDILEKEIAKTESEIKKAQLEIEKITLEISGVQSKIQEKEEEVEDQKKVLSEYIRLIQQYDARSPLELLLGSESFSAVLDQAEYVETLESKGQETLDDIQDLKSELQWHMQVLEAKNDKQKALEAELTTKNKTLTSERQGKDRLLAVTEEQEDKYQELLVESRKEYESANTEISGLEGQVQKKLQEQQASKERPSDFQEYSGSGALAWPVQPKRGISAEFMDPSYKNYFGVPHYAIDIPTPQNSTIYAPADGYVVKYRNAGYGYSYLMIHHGNGLSTVYGHVTSSLVAEGSYVKQGDPVATSGGAPGTPGAGWMTTGPHLHFETRMNGKPVNPRNFLP